MADTTQNQGADKAGATKKESPKKDAPKPTPKTSTPKTGKKPFSKKPKKKGAHTLVWLMLAVIFVSGTLVAGWPVIGPWAKRQYTSLVTKTRDGVGLKPRQTQARLPQTRLPQARLPQESLPQKSPVPVQTPAPVTIEKATPPRNAVQSGVLARRVDDLDARLNALNTVNDTGALAELKAQVAALGVRIQALEEAQGQLRTRGSARAASAQALLLAATQLRARLMAGSPYDEDLTALKKIAPDDADIADVIARLRLRAAKGVPDKTDLIARYDLVAKAIMRARVKAQTADQGWIGTLKAGLGSLITVRRTDPATITDKVERAVAVAKRALGQGNLNRAVDALGALQGPEADAAAPWLSDARARLDAQKAVETLYRYALVAMSATGGT